MKFVKFFTFLTACILFVAPIGAQERVISIGGDVTELIYALKAEQNLVGRDSTSITPEAATELPDVGYMRQLNAEGILALKPTKVIVTQVAQPAVVLEQIKAAGVKVENVPFDYTAEGLLKKIQVVGGLVNRPEQARELSEKVTDELKKVKNSPLNVRILFVLNRAGVNQMAAGKNTVADNVIHMIGATNAMGDSVRFSPLSQEGVIAAAPDLVVMTRMGFDNLGSEEKVWALEGLAMTPAGKRKKLVVVDDLAFLSFSLKTPQEMLKIRQAAEKIAENE